MVLVKLLAELSACLEEVVDSSVSDAVVDVGSIMALFTLKAEAPFGSGWNFFNQGSRDATVAMRDET
jgi:hypothetical protein